MWIVLLVALNTPNAIVEMRQDKRVVGFSDKETCEHYTQREAFPKDSRAFCWSGTGLDSRKAALSVVDVDFLRNR